MAGTCFGQAAEDGELATFVVTEADAPPTPSGEQPSPEQAPVQAVPDRPAEARELPLEQMTLRIDGGLLMVLGPEGDPVPPKAFATAAAARPDTRLALPGGASVPASRIAAVLKAQSLGRLGAAEQGEGWILAMLREGQGPAPASDEALRAEEKGEPFDRSPPAADEAPDVRAASGEILVPASPAPPIAPPPDNGHTDNGHTDNGHADNAQAAASESRGREPIEVDPERIVLVVMRGVPQGARLSTGVRDEDGSWSISPLDLDSVTIGLADGAAPDGAGELSITGIALDEAGELVAVAETVPLADYLSVPGAEELGDGEGGSPKAAADPADSARAAGAGAPRAIPLAIDPQACAGEAFDALVIRDLPAGARLSAGAYDAAIDGWVLMPQDLSALAMLPPPDLRGDVILTLTAIALRPGDADRARVLARLPVVLS